MLGRALVGTSLFATLLLSAQAREPACGQAYTSAPAIQGREANSPLSAKTVTTEGVVVGDYEGPAPALRGFYLQDRNGDGDPATSDAVFVFHGDDDSVQVGDVVRVTGRVTEFRGQTQISASMVQHCGTGSVEPIVIRLPMEDAQALERHEGMLVTLPQTLYVTGHFHLGRFGQILVSANDRQAQPTSVATPGEPARALQAQNELARLIVDDGNNAQYAAAVFGRGGQPLSAANTLRGGDTVTGLTGVLTWTWAGHSASGDAWRVRPTGALGGVASFEARNLRPPLPPRVEGEQAGETLRVASLNLLNYFNTFNDRIASTPGCLPSGTDADCRGAESAFEFERQSAKTVRTLLGLDADVVALIEIENDGYGATSTLSDLVARLNAATAQRTYAYVNVDAGTGHRNALGRDAIKVALIYKPATVRPVGDTAVLDTPAFVNGGDATARNRPALAQAFATPHGGSFIAVVNHLKSKGSPCDAPAANDGQGECNQVRTRGIRHLLAWLQSDPTATGETRVLMLGDLNAYAMEDPVHLLVSAGYVDLVRRHAGERAYSYVFDGQWGYLDHAFASPSLAAQVSGAAVWHVSADEPTALDYNVNFKSANQLETLYRPDAYRNSDHDPVLIGVSLGSPHRSRPEPRASH
jgi:predicted extracellular nuclease